MSELKKNKENESCSTTWIDPETVVEPYSDPQTSPLGPQKDKDDPKIKSNLYVRIQGIIENEHRSTTWVDPKTVFEPHIEPKNSPLRQKLPSHIEKAWWFKTKKWKKIP